MEKEFIGTVKIGPMTYPVYRIEGLRDGDRKLDGWIRYAEGDIQIERNLALQTHQQTLFHECVHAINNQYGLGLNEANTDRLAYGLMAFLQDNPNLRFLMEVKHDDPV